MELTQAQQDSLQAALRSPAGADPAALTPAQLASLGLGSPEGGVSVDSQATREFIDNIRDTSGALAAGAVNGLSFGFADEATGATSALGSLLTSETMPDAYARGRDNVRDTHAQIREANPGTYMAGDIAGGVASSLAAIPATVGKTTLGTTARMAGVGAAEGGLFGLGNSEGSLSEKAEQTALGAGIGGTLGLAAGPLAALMQQAPRVARGALVDTPLGRPNQSRANRYLASQMAREGTAPDQIAASMREAVADGQPMFNVADAMGVTGQRALSANARLPGKARTMIADALNNRQMNAGDRMSQFVADGFNAPDTAAARRTALQGQRADDAAVNYDAARQGASPVDVRGALATIDARLGPMSQGGDIVGDGIDSVFARYRNRLAAQNPPAGTTASELSDFDRVLNVKQDMADDIGAAVRGGRGNEANLLGSVQSKLDEALEASSGGYRAANDTYREQSRVLDAIADGEAASRPRNRQGDTIPDFQSRTPDQQAAFRAGYADPLIARVEAARQGANRAGPLMTDKAQAEIGAFAVDPQRLQRQVGRENTMFESRAQALGGSRTAENLADMEDVSSVNMGMLANVFAGRLGAAGTQAAQAVANASTGRNEATRQLIARALLSNDPQQALAPVLRQAERSTATNQMLQRMIRGGGLRVLNGE